MLAAAVASQPTGFGGLWVDLLCERYTYCLPALLLPCCCPALPFPAFPCPAGGPPPADIDMPTAMALLGMGEDDAPYSRISLLRKTPRHLIHSFFTDEYGKSVFNLFDTHALAAYAGHWVFTSDDPRAEALLERWPGAEQVLGEWMEEATVLRALPLPLKTQPPAA